MYEAYYHLRDKPFQLNPDPRFFYGSRGHKRAFSYLEYGLSLGEGFIIITGDVGAGKTMLVKHLVKKLERGNYLAANLVSTQLDADDMLRSVSAAFGLDYEHLSKAALLNNLQTFLRDTLRQGRRALLIVDEAQNLSPKAVEELRMLSNFQEGEKSLLQSFLLGQPEFRDTLQSPQMQQLRQRVIASYHLGPMDRDETMGYILHRLKTAGWQGNPAFAEDAFDAIHAFSGGVPRRINTLCDRLLLFGFLEERNQFDAKAVQEVIADLRQEVHHQAAPAREPPTPATAMGHNPVSVTATLPPDLEERLTQIERGLTRLIPMVRKILYNVSEGQERD
jgi:putative secretion ATPase (PEP-CTERM system associated)